VGDEGHEVDWERVAIDDGVVGRTRQFSITGPAGLALSLPTLRGESPAYAIAGAAVILLARLLPYAFALYTLRKGKPFTVEDHGVKIMSDGDGAALAPSVQRAHQTRVRRRRSGLLPSWALVLPREGTSVDNNALRRIVQKAKSVIDKSAEKKLQTAADDLWRRHAGQSVDRVRAAIKAHPTLRKVERSDDTINSMAETIAGGKRFYLRARRVR
jgi:hypothetical protein